MDSNQTLQIVVTVELQGNILNYLCEDPYVRVPRIRGVRAGLERDLCKCIILTGDQSPCRTDGGTSSSTCSQAR